MSEIIRNGNKTNFLGWLAFVFSLSIQLTAATWIIAKMDAAISELKGQVQNIVNTQNTQNNAIEQNTLDIKLIQQCCTKR